MPYTAQLQFAQKLLKNMNISTHIAEDPEKIISKDIDLGLRALLFGRDNYKDFLQNSMSEAENNTIYRFFDEYYCHYVFMRLPAPRTEHYFFYWPVSASISAEGCAAE